MAMQQQDLPATDAADSTVDPAEIAKFSKLSEDWWNPNGKMAPLHKINPLRLAYIRDAACRKFERNAKSLSCLSGLRILDIGCGAGLLCEPLARLGAKVTGVDASPEVIAVARQHASAMGLSIDYRAGDVQELEGQFDLVTSLEVIEHVAEPAAFLKALARRLAPGGLLILSTPNATGWSKLMMITLGEGLGRIPKGTHDFDKFISPERMKVLLADADLQCLDTEGIAWSPTRGLHLSEDLRLNYLISAVRS